MKLSSKDKNMTMMERQNFKRKIFRVGEGKWYLEDKERD